MNQFHRLRGAQRAIAVMFFNLGFGYANWLACIPSVRERLNLNDAQLGMLLLSGAVGAVVAFRIAPALIAIHGTRRVGTVGSAAFGLLVALPAFAPSGLWAGAALFCAGWFNGLMDVALNAQGVEVERKLGKPILATLHGCYSLGSFVGAAAGAGAAVLAWSPGPYLGSMGVLLLLSSWLVGKLLLADAPVVASNLLPTRPPAALLLLGAVAFCSSIGEGAMAEWAAIYLRDILHTSMGLAVTGFATFSLAMVTGRLLGDRYTHNASAKKILVTCGLVATGSLALGLLTNSPALFVASTLGVGAGLSLVVPVVLRAAMALPGIAAPRALSIMATLSYGGFLFGPPIIGFVSNQFGLTCGMGVVACATLLLAGLASRVGSGGAVQGGA